MRYLFVKIIFIVFLLQIFCQNNGLVYCQSKYHNSKKKTELKDNIPKPASDLGAEQLKDEAFGADADMGTKDYWTGILFYPKSKQPHDKEFEEKAFKILGDTFYKIKRIKLFGESLFVDKLKELGISDKSIVLFPENVVGIKDVQIIVVVMYMHNKDNVISVEVRLMDIEKGDFFKLSPDNFLVEEIEAKILNIGNALTEKIVKLIDDAAKASHGSLNVSAVECFEKGKAYNVANMYLRAKKELETAIKIDPSMSDAYLELGFSEFMISKDRKKQIEILEYGIKRNSKDFKLYLELGKLYAITGNKEEARQKYNYIIIMDRDGKTEYYNQAQNLMKTLDFE